MLGEEYKEKFIIYGYTENNTIGRYFFKLRYSLNIPTANYTESVLIHKDLHVCVEHTNTHTHTHKRQKPKKRKI